MAMSSGLYLMSMFWWIFFLVPIGASDNAKDEPIIQTDKNTMIYSEIDLKKSINIPNVIESKLLVNEKVKKEFNKNLTNLYNSLGLEDLSEKELTDKIGLDLNKKMIILIPDMLNFVSSISASEKKRYYYEYSVKKPGPSFPDMVMAVPYSDVDKIYKQIENYSKKFKAETESIGHQGQEILKITIPFTYTIEDYYSSYKYNYAEKVEKSVKANDPPKPKKKEKTIPVELLSYMIDGDYLYISNSYTLKMLVTKQKELNSNTKKIDLSIEVDKKIFNKNKGDHLASIYIDIASYYNEFGPDVPASEDYQAVMNIDFDEKGFKFEGIANIPDFLKNSKLIENYKAENIEKINKKSYVRNIPKGVAAFSNVYLDLKPLLNKIPLWKYWIPYLYYIGVAVDDDSRMFTLFLRNILTNFKGNMSVVYYKPEKSHLSLKDPSDLDMLIMFDTRTAYRSIEFITLLERLVRKETSKEFRVIEIMIGDAYFYKFIIENKEAFIIGRKNNYLVFGTNIKNIEKLMNNIDNQEEAGFKTMIPEDLQKEFDKSIFSCYVPLSDLTSDDLKYMQERGLSVKKQIPFLIMSNIKDIYTYNKFENDENYFIFNVEFK